MDEATTFMDPSLMPEQPYVPHTYVLCTIFVALFTFAWIPAV